MTNNNNHIHDIPESVRPEIEKALSYYPQLKDVPIRFLFKKNIKKSTMQAQPTWGSFFKPRSSRSYIILMSERFKISGKSFKTKDIPSDIFIGWIGHELGHVMDYQNRSNWNLIDFGVRYLLFESHIVEAERTADSYAIQQGMEDYILKTKDFILNHADIDPKYVERIKKYYLSPEEIMELVQNRDTVLS
ncbi:hypothetical protein Q2T40_10860 [Winogradskyella maritima]|uniref:Uncharacterized protein n=1 Tax=Winogradskyella maritima TaxID=1517766 RepID=A0ABV8AMH5_9FLAO|nr:hypothetical protein [Winogradskyella maritima]